MRSKDDLPEIFVPDGLAPQAALARTTHMAIAAHQDDLEIMAFAGILACFQRDDRWFCGVVVTDGSGSPRDDLYKNYTDDAMRAIRRKEQKKAAVVGEYGAQVLLDYPSAAVKDGTNRAPTRRHGTPAGGRPARNPVHPQPGRQARHARGCRAQGDRSGAQAARSGTPAAPLTGARVWRDLDWMVDADKVAFDCSAHENLQAALLGVFDSQISGGKRYDLATMGRRRANATYYAAHSVDVATGLAFAMDLTPLVTDPALDVQHFVQEFVDRFAQDVKDRLERLS